MLDASVLVGVVAVVAAAVLHELTHVAAAAPVATRTRVEWRSMTVESDLPASLPRWVDRVISLAPLLAGASAALVVWAAGLVPAFNADTALLYAAWAVYTMGGSLDDYQATLVDAETATATDARGDLWVTILWYLVACTVGAALAVWAGSAVLGGLVAAANTPLLIAVLGPGAESAEDIVDTKRVLWKASGLALAAGVLQAAALIAPVLLFGAGACWLAVWWFASFEVLQTPLAAANPNLNVG